MMLSFWSACIFLCPFSISWFFVCQKSNFYRFSIPSLSRDNLPYSLIGADQLKPIMDLTDGMLASVLCNWSTCQLSCLHAEWTPVLHSGCSTSNLAPSGCTWQSNWRWSILWIMRQYETCEWKIWPSSSCAALWMKVLSFHLLLRETHWGSI